MTQPSLESESTLAEDSAPYAQLLGFTIVERSPETVAFEVPFREGNTNPGKNLHGGVVGSMINLAARALAREALGAGSDPIRTVSVQVNYLSAPIGRAVKGGARLLRKGKELCFIEVRVEDPDGKPVAQGSVITLARFGAENEPTPLVGGDQGAVEPGFFGHMHTIVPFFKTLGLRVENVSGRSARVRLPFKAEHLDASGNVAEGAVLSLLDTAGAMAAWTVIKPGPYRSATVGLNARIVGVATPGRDLVAFAHPVARDREIFWTQVEVAQADTLELIATGDLVYRIILPDGVPNA